MKRPRARNFESKDIEIREINNDIEFSEFIEQLLEKTHKFISNKCSHKYGKRKIDETSTESKPGSSQLRNCEVNQQVIKPPKIYPSLPKYQIAVEPEP